MAGTQELAELIDGFAQARQGQVRLQLSDVLRTVVSQRLLPARAPGLRLPAVEILQVTRAVGALIREGRSHQIATAIHKRQSYQVIYRQKQVDAEISLLNLLHKLRPARCPADLLGAYDEVTESLRVLPG